MFNLSLSVYFKESLKVQKFENPEIASFSFQIFLISSKYGLLHRTILFPSIARLEF